MIYLQLLMMTGWIIQTGWKILTHAGMQNLDCLYNFYGMFVLIWLAYESYALFIS